MIWVLALAVGIPLLDLYLLFQLTHVVGLMNTVALALGTAFLGTLLLRREGVTVLQRLQRAVMVEEVGQSMVEAAVLAVGGLLLLTPGLVTDALGALCVVSRTRTRLAAWLRTRLQESDRVHVSVQGPGQLR